MSITTKKLVSMFFAGSVVVTAFVSTAAAEDPPFVRIRNFTYGGTGCPGGTVGWNITSDGKILTVLYDQFSASAGPGISISETRRQCTLNVDLEYPQGWSYSLFTADYRGRAKLDAGVIGTQESSYYFSGSPLTVKLGTRIVGPTNQDYFRRDTLGIEATVWSPCGSIVPVNIRASVDVDNRSVRANSGLLTVDSSDFKVTQIYGVQWKKCP